MNLQADALAILWLGTAIALFFLLMRLFGGWLSNRSSPLVVSIGKAVLTVYP